MNGDALAQLKQTTFDGCEHFFDTVAKAAKEAESGNLEKVSEKTQTSTNTEIV